MDCGSVYEKLELINLSEHNVELWKKNRVPLSATIEITPKCNFRCIHCYLGKHRDEVEELSTDSIKHILDELAENGTLFVTFTGGECMLREDFDELYLYAKRKGFMVCVFTNAYTLNAKLFELFDKYPPFFVDVSLYGASNDTYKRITGVDGGFDVVINNLKELKKRNIEFGIKTPLFKQNIGDYEAMCKICEELGAKYRFSFALSPTLDKEDYPTSFMVSPETMIRLESSDPVYRGMGENYASINNEWGEAFDAGEFVPLYICAPGVNDVFVNYLGEAMPCASFRCEAQSMLNKPFKQIWDDFARFRKIPASADYKCMRCESRYYCKVCPADQLQYHGDAESIDPLTCAHAHARYRLYKQGIKIEEVISLLKKELNKE